MIRPTIELTTVQRRQFVGKTKAAARIAARRQLTVLGEQWEREVKRIVEEELPDRDGDRHKTNTTHLSNSFTHRIVEGSDQGFPMQLMLTTKPGVSAAKIASLEYGVKEEHEIAARNTDFLRWGDAPGDLHQPGLESVTWKPTGRIRVGWHFMARARRAVLARRAARR